MKDGAATAPNRTEVAPPKSDPVTVTCPPPDVGPLSGTTAWTWGEMKVYSLAGTAALVPAAGAGGGDGDRQLVAEPDVGGDHGDRGGGVADAPWPPLPPKWTVGTTGPEPGCR